MKTDTCTKSEREFLDAWFKESALANVDIHEIGNRVVAENIPEALKKKYAKSVRKYDQAHAELLAVEEEFENFGTGRYLSNAIALIKDQIREGKL